MPELKRLAILGILCGVLAVLLFRIPATGRQDIRASRYTQIVESLFISPRLLVASGGAEPQITYHAPADPREARLADWYYRSSYLQDDVQRFNEGSPQGRLIFDLDHQQLAHINPAAHTFRPSLAPHGRWIGKLLYAAQSHTASLSLQGLDSNATINIVPLAHPFAQEPESSHGYVSLFAPGGSVTGSIIHFEAGRTEIAHAWLMGDGLLLKLDASERDSRVLIRIDGRALHGSVGDVYEVSRSSVLLFEDHRPWGSRLRRRTSTWIVRDPVAPDVAYDGRTGLWHRTGHDPLLPRLQSVLAVLASASPRDVDSDVRLTLSRSAEAEAGQILEDALTSGGTSSTSPAAITLMDGVSGALLALPSWPPGPATSSQRYPGATVQNQNFTRHPVGSVAKILFAPAVLDTHPALLRLTLPSLDSPTFNSVLGLPLHRAIQGDAYAYDHLDFTTAIILSSNRYFVTLLTLASNDPHVRAQGSQDISPATDDYWIGGRLHTRRPRQLIFDPGTPDSLSVLGLAWVARMRHLLDVNVATPLTADRVSRQYIWDGLPPALQPRTPEARRMFDSISPEYENLRLEAIRNTALDFGTKYVSLTLGAGESLWTNVELAEAVSSLLQNRPVRASLVASDGSGDVGSDAPSAFEYHKLKPAVQQALADAMSGVVRDPAIEQRWGGPYSTLRGTASVLDATRVRLAQAACARDEAFALFAKTGTPTLIEAHESPEAELFNEMAKAQLFKLNAAGAIVYTGLATPASPGGRVLTRRDLRLLRKLRDHGTGLVAQHFRRYFETPSKAVEEDLVACREEYRLTPRRLWSRVMGIVAENNETPEFPVVKVDGPVLSYEHQCTTMKTPDRTNINGRHIVMLAAVYPRAAVMGGDADCDGAIPHIDVVHYRPTRAVAAVVAIADPQRMKSTLDVAKKLLEGPIAEHLQLQIDTTAEDPR